jgi:hypothetical protein
MITQTVAALADLIHHGMIVRVRAAGEYSVFAVQVSGLSHGCASGCSPAFQLNIQVRAASRRDLNFLQSISA